MIKKEGIGSYFHFENFKETKHNEVTLPFNYEIFYTGRHALLYILDKITAEGTISKIWFPNYYCQHTLTWIKKNYPNINTYDLNPFEFNSNPINLSEFANQEDIVLINNYWGLSSMYTEKSPNAPIIIEDHSHGWLSDACLKSKADYCFASVRKSLPVPLGGIYWEPNSASIKSSMNFLEDHSFYDIWERMLLAMTLKKISIENKSPAASETYLPLFYEVEEKLNNYTTFVKLKTEHKHYIEQFLKFDALKAKASNLNILYSQINDNDYFKIIKRSGYTAFGLHLVFKDELTCNSLKACLITNKIYPSMLWPHNNIDNKWQFFMNFHIDFRYNENDMLYIIKIMNSWVSNQTSKNEH